MEKIKPGVDFRKISSASSVAQYLAATINKHLARGERVLWLVTGGSSIEVAVLTAQLLDGSKLDKLTVTLTDERYGTQDHPDSNWHQLIQGGLSLTTAKIIPILTGKNFETTVADFNTTLKDQFQKADYKLGLLGVGPDGHVVGIKPNSPALNSPHMAFGYDWDDYMRITMTPSAIASLDEAVSYIVGQSKRQVLKNLLEDLPAKDQPAQLLKLAPKLTIFNDYKGEK